MPRPIMCKMGNCLEWVGEAGVSVTLRTKDHNDDQRAVYCSAYHAALAMLALADERKEPVDTAPLRLYADIPRSWKSA